MHGLAQWLITYVDKLGMLVSGMLVLAALVTTDWTPYGRSAEELVEQVNAARAGLTGDWPASSRDRYLHTDRPRDVVDQFLDRRIAVADYAMSQRQIKSMWPADRAAREPQFLPLQQPVVDTERVLIALAPEGPRPEPTTPVKSTADEETIRDEFLRDRPAEFSTDTLIEPLQLIDDREPPSRVGRGYPYVAIRAVLDVRSQIEEYARALRMTYAAASRQFEVLDYQLERQQRRRDRDPWSEWQAVDDRVFRDVLFSAAGRAPDVVSSHVIDPAMTCPLPSRITGRWQSLATHPALARVALTDDERHREQALLDALVRLHESANARDSQAIRKGGFTDLQPDAGRLERDFLDAAASDAQKALPGWLRGRNRVDASQSRMIDWLLQELDSELPDPELRSWLVARSGAVDREVLLFRYLDFDVAPGTDYRYRVRLVVRNPNYGRSLVAVGGNQHIRSGLTRTTPWSEATPPVTVEPLTRYFVARVDAGRDLWPKIQMTVFQYETTVGTTIRQSVTKQVGDAIRGTAMTQIADPAAREIRTERYTVHSDDVLVDALGDLRFAASEHPGLELPGRSLGFARIDEIVLIAASDGVLEMVDVAEQTGDLARQEYRLDLQERQLEHLRLADADAIRAGGMTGSDYPGYGGERVDE